jgi:tight adherence protein B
MLYGQWGTNFVMSPLLIMLVVGVAVYAIFMLVFPKAAPDEKDANLKTALNRLYEENRATEASHVDILRDQLKEESALIRGIFSLPFMRPLHEAGLQAGYQSSLMSLFLFMIMTIAGVLIVFLLLGMSMSLAVLIALPLGYYIPYRQCKGKVRKRNREFIDQFPDALDMIVRSVRSGFPLSTALQMLAENAEEPVREEFRKVVDDIALGRSLSQALGRLSLRINEPDIRFFVVVLSVQQETGGNLSEIISNLSGVIRKRKQLRHRIKALTSEGKATGWVLGGLPVFVFGILYYIQPEYLEPFWTDSLGKMMFGGVLGLLGICFVVVKEMLNIDI